MFTFHFVSKTAHNIAWNGKKKHLDLMNETCNSYRQKKEKEARRREMRRV